MLLAQSLMEVIKQREKVDGWAVGAGPTLRKCREKNYQKDYVPNKFGHLRMSYPFFFFGVVGAECEHLSPLMPRVRAFVEALG